MKRNTLSGYLDRGRKGSIIAPGRPQGGLMIDVIPMTEVGVKRDEEK